MTQDFKGKVAIVTGGTRGLGAAITRHLLRNGCTVATCGRNAPQEVLSVDGRSASFDACDIRDAAQAASFVNKVADRHGGIDILINNAGGSPPAAAATASPRFSEAIVALNLLAPLHMSQAAYPHLKARRGNIVNIASVAAIRPAPGTSIYGAAKAGLLGLTTNLAQEWGPDIRVNAVIVGLIETETTEQTYGSPQTQARVAASLPLKRLGRGEEIAEAVAFLASPAAGYISGSQLAVHGGGDSVMSLRIVAEDAAAS